RAAPKTPTRAPFPRQSKGAAELLREDPGPAVEVRLEDCDHPARTNDLPGGAEDDGHLGRVVGVVVDNSDVGRDSDQVEPPSHSGVLGKAGTQAIWVCPDRLAREEGATGVEDVVVPGHPNPEPTIGLLVVGELEAGSALLALDVQDAQVIGRMLAVGQDSHTERDD